MSPTSCNAKGKNTTVLKITRSHAHGRRECSAHFVNTCHLKLTCTHVPHLHILQNDAHIIKDLHKIKFLYTSVFCNFVLSMCIFSASQIRHLELKVYYFLSEILSGGPVHTRVTVNFTQKFPAARCASHLGRQGAAARTYHSFREFNQEKEKTWRAGSESAPPPLPEADACPWGEEASNPICKRRKCG